MAADHAPEHTPVAAHLPAVFAADRESFDQVEGFLALVDELNRAHLERLAELPSWYGPGASAWPPDLPVDAGGDAVLARVSALYDELADWYGFVFPGSWRDPEGLVRKRRFLFRAARIWRRRGTPRGFVDWFCLWFGIRETRKRPVLVEHFKFATDGERTGTPRTAPDGRPLPPPWLRATLFVPVSSAFPDAATRTEAALFVERYAPAHVLMRLCWARGDFVLGEPEAGDEESVERFRERVRELLCESVDFTDHASALKLGRCFDQGRVTDRLDVGRLPTDVTEE